jgi:acetyltransferase-like isoleucine patch superfamily enzyme
VTIGEGAVIAACSVDTRNVEPSAIKAGSPARKISERNRNLVYELSFRPFLQ